MKQKNHFPEKPLSKSDLLAYVKKLKLDDVDWKSGKAFCLVYYPGDERAKMVKEIYDEFYAENALNPSATPSLIKLENEAIAMCISLFNGDEHVRGNLTSGGTESILLSIKSARDWARKNHPKIKHPQVIIPESGHPAFMKAFKYFGLEPIIIPLKDYRADPVAMEKAITDDTILMVASAPSYPHGLIDPIKEIGLVAKRNNLLFHVDSCIGGFILPFINKLGYPIPEFDFKVDGVTSLSADLHKYGYSPKGASVILYKDADLRKHQFSVYTNWSGGVYGSPTIGGSRPGGSIAGAWAALKGIAEDGYLEMAKATMETTKRLILAVNEIDDLNIIGVPLMSIVSFESDSINVYQLADVLNKKGWHFERQQLPPSLHFTINFIHVGVIDQFIKDLKDSIKEVKRFSIGKLGESVKLQAVKGLKNILPKGAISKIQKSQSSSKDLYKEKQSPMYGMMNLLAGSDDLDEIVLDFLDKINSPDKK